MGIKETLLKHHVSIDYPAGIQTRRFSVNTNSQRLLRGRRNVLVKNLTEYVKKNSIFWDIESYDNLFCCAMIDDYNHLEMFYLVNNRDDEQELIRACNDSGYSYTLYDLSKSMERFKWHFEKRIPRTAQSSLLADFLGVEDKEVKPKKYWYFGYNTLNYDVPMCDNLINSTLSNKLQTTTASIRQFSDSIINGTARRLNTNDYQQYANQVDCAFLNEKMVDEGRVTIGLKTLVGVKGGSIVESESNKSGHSEDIYGDVLYNINDVAELRDVVYPGQMETTYKIRKSLLSRFPKLSEHGITVNSTSAKFVEFIVSPDGPIEDTPTVSFMYPAKHVAERLGVPQTDVLEDFKTWYLENVFARVAKNNLKAAKAHLAKFMSVYSYYDSVRGKNWNESAAHAMQYGIPAQTKENRKELFDVYGTFLPFIDEYGNDSHTYANFSLGGIHGAEIFYQQLEADRAKIRELKEKYGKVSWIPKGEVSAKLYNLIKVQSRSRYKDYPQHMSHEVPYMFERTEEIDDIIDPDEFTPYMYDKSKKKEVLINRYKYTSIGNAVHQDFAGYYPMILINSGAFYDGNGTDLYDDVYQYRLGVKAQLKTIPYGTMQYELVDIEQGGYKLVLNSASGVLDGTFDTNLRANNKAMAMRIIGQIFTYRIGLMLALEGASVPSSNTDGIYVFNIELQKNIELVDAELKKLYVEIDPEPVYLVSKDANNRMELVDGKVVSARGGSLTSWSGARVDNRLSHPALVDKVLTYYLQNDVIDGPVNDDLIRTALHEYHDNPTILDEFKHYPDAAKRTFVYMASWVLRSTSGSIMIDDNNQIYPGTVRAWLSKDGVAMSRYNTKKQKPSKTLDEYASKLFDDTRMGNPDLLRYLMDINAYDKYFDKAITVREYKEARLYEPDVSVSIIAQAKISNLEDDARLYINNHSILKLSEEEVDNIYQQIDMESYVTMIHNFAIAWHNELQPTTKIKK